MKVKILDNSMNAGWNVGDTVEISEEDAMIYGGSEVVEILEALEAPKPVKKSKRVIKKRK